MNKKKRVLIHGLVLVMMAALLLGGLSALAAEEPDTYELSFNFSKTELLPGEEATVTVSLANYADLSLKNILDLQLNISIDTD